MEDWTTLEFTSPDPCRTTLVNSAHKAVYTASTDENPGAQPLTAYTDASGYAFASLEWRMYFSDKLQIGDGEKRVVGKWLKKNGKGKRSEMTFESGGETYSWRGFEQAGPLQLFLSSSPDPLASFTPSISGPNRGDSDLSPAFLRLSPRLLQTQSPHVQTHIVLSLLLIEKARRFGGAVPTGKLTGPALGLLGFGSMMSLGGGGSVGY